MLDDVGDGEDHVGQAFQPDVAGPVRLESLTYFFAGIA
jgi:hypothetical protein